MSQLEVNLNTTLSIFEKGLNIGGYVPVVSTFSGALRFGYGKLEVVGGIAAAAFFAIAALFSPDAQSRERGLQKALTILTTYSLHGIANIFRGGIEMVPFVSLFTCLPYDLMSKRFAYPGERSGHWEYINDRGSVRT